MKCGKCGYENKEESKFCACCGSALEPETQRDGRENGSKEPGDQQGSGENFQGAGYGPYMGQQPYNGYNNYGNFGMMPPSERDRENHTANTLAVLAIIIGIFSIVFSAMTIFIGVNYGAIAAFILAIGAVVKAKPGCVKGTKTAAVVIAVIALVFSTFFSFAGNVSVHTDNNQDIQEFYDDYNDGFYDDFFREFGGEFQDDFSNDFGVNFGGGENV